MTETDTVKLAKECGSGARMAISAIDTLEPYISNAKFISKLDNARTQHKKIVDASDSLLRSKDKKPKNPGVVAKAMADAKINAVMTVANTKSHAAALMTDGCNMGIKTTCRMKNKYSFASPEAMNLAQDLINCEKAFLSDMEEFL